MKGLPKGYETPVTAPPHLARPASPGEWGGPSRPAEGRAHLREGGRAGASPGREGGGLPREALRGVGEREGGAREGGQGGEGAAVGCVCVCVQRGKKYEMSFENGTTKLPCSERK